MITQVQTIDLRLGSVAPTMRYNVVAVGGVFRETWFRQLGSVLSASTPNKKGILRSTDKVNLGQRNREGARCGDDLSVNATETLPCIGSAMIDSSTPSTNYGGAATGSAGTYFDVAGSKRKTECYLGFGDLSHLIGHTIVSAKLRVRALSFRAAPVLGVSDRTWDSMPGASETRVKFGFYLSELPTSEVPLISWGGIVVKGDSAGNVKLYLDGVLKITIGGYNGPTFIGLRAGLLNGQGYYNRVEAALETVLGTTYVTLVVYNGFALSSQSQPVGGLSFIWNELCYFDPALVLRAFPDCYAYTNGSGTSFVYTYSDRGSSSVPDGTAATYVMLAFGTDVGPPLPLSLYSASQGSWAESSVTWLNRPNIHTGLGLTENVNPSPGGPGAVVQALVEFDLTGQFQAALYLGYIDMTFLVAGPGDIYTCTGVDDPPSVLVDLRTGGTPPELVVEYEA
jgi:hypothetical protein